MLAAPSRKTANGRRSTRASQGTAIGATARVSPEIMKALSLSAAIGAVACVLLQPSAHALDTMESIGAEKCARAAAKAYEIEFLAPDNAAVEAKAKVVVRGATDERSEALPTLHVAGWVRCYA